MPSLTPTLSPSESARFGLPVYRATAETLAQAQALAAWFDTAPSSGVVIVRLPAGAPALRATLLQRRCGRHADSLVYYSRPIRSAEPQADVEPLPSGIHLRRAHAEDKKALEALALRGFSGYISHYAASPELFAPAHVAAGYAQWASHLLTEPQALTWVAHCSNGALAGFIACRPCARNRLDIVLNAVDPDFRRRGIYLALLRKARREAPPGTCGMTVSTQLWNYPVQRAWIGDGYVIQSAQDTYHVSLQP